MADAAELMQMTVIGRRALTAAITEFALAGQDGTILPEFEPGAHITIETPSGAMRRYSLINEGRDPNRYIIAVKREPLSRGGSASMHEDALVGTTLQVTAPQNDFQLIAAPNYLLIAGGIGITPIFAMAKWMQATHKPFHLIYCTRCPDDTAYLEEVRTHFESNAVVHHDEGDPGKVFDFWDNLETPNNSHVYCCGPAPMMEDIRGMSGHWPEGRIHFEDFNPVEVVRATDTEFAITIAATGEMITVPAERSILEALRDAGLKTVSSCESGTCGTCKTKLISGSVDHRDMVLEECEKRGHIMICVSRAADGDLIIDL